MSQQLSGPTENGKCVQSGKGEVMETERISEESKHLYEKAIMRMEEVSRQHKEIQMLCEQALKRADAIHACSFVLIRIVIDGP